MNFVEYFDVFIVIYNAGVAFVLIFLIAQIIFMMQKIDKNVLKARIFLNDEILKKTWTFISIAGAAFAINSLVKIAIEFTTQGLPLKNLYIVQISQLVFLLSFILAVYNWYVFIGSFTNQKISEEA